MKKNKFLLLSASLLVSSLIFGQTYTDTITVPMIKTHRVGLFPGDSLVRLGDSSFVMNLNNNNIYTETGVICNICQPHYGGIALGFNNYVSGSSLYFTPSIAVGNFNYLSNGGMALGSSNTLSTGIAIGSSNTISGSGFITIGAGLTNTISGAILMGNSISNKPAISIIPDPSGNTAGEIGICTTTPSAFLSINVPSTLSIPALNIINGTNTSLFTVFAPELSSIGCSTLIGIGTNNPQSAINIMATVSTPANTTLPQFMISNPTGNVCAIDQNGDAEFNGHVVLGLGLGAYASIHSTVEAYELYNNYTYPLNVYGTIWAQEVKVCLSGCDFVFDKGYKLISIDSLQTYLQQNKHLPGIASAKEMESSDGVELGKTSSQLLQKVEELTLYVIQQQKEIEELKQKVEYLTKK